MRTEVLARLDALEKKIDKIISMLEQGDPITTLWAKLDEQWEWLAQDKDGEVYAYTHEPYHDSSDWDTDERMKDMSGTIKAYSGDWKESLRKRP